MQEGRAWPRRRTVAKRAANLSGFSGDQVALVDEVIDYFWHYNATEISALSHRASAGWNLAAEKEDIPYETALISTKPPRRNSRSRTEAIRRTRARYRALMLTPREWRVETGGTFDDDVARIGVAEADRLAAHIRAWKWQLEREPFVYSEGLTAPDDDIRVIASTDPMLECEFVAGVTIDRRNHIVEIRWVDVVPLPEQEDR